MGTNKMLESKFSILREAVTPPATRPKGFPPRGRPFRRPSRGGLASSCKKLDTKSEKKTLPRLKLHLPFPFIVIKFQLSKMHPARGRDPRVDKIRRHLREGTTIPKEDLLDFVNVYPRFWESGWKVRSGLVKWINRNSETVLGWFPDILKARPGYFEDPRSGTRASTYDGYETFVALGLAGQSSPRPTDLGVNATSPPSSSDPDMPPTRPKQKTLSDFGARMPDSACQKRPSLAEMVQQQVWLEDITEAHKRLKKLKKWLVQVAEGLGHDDGWKDLLSSAAETIPDLSDRVETAQLCFEDVKLNYEKSCAEQARKRAELSRTTRYSPSLGADDDDAPSSAPVEEKEDLSSIRVESDIIGVVTHTTPITPRTSTSATFANAQFGHIQSPATKSNNPPFPRRSVMVSSSPWFCHFVTNMASFEPATSNPSKRSILGQRKTTSASLQ